MAQGREVGLNLQAAPLSCCLSCSQASPAAPSLQQCKRARVREGGLVSEDGGSFWEAVLPPGTQAVPPFP